nr:hypothetical protein [Tanacetum cinerariifolium]
MTTSVVNNSVFKGFFEKHKLTVPNFIYWYRKLRIVLSVEDKVNYLEHPIPAAHVLARAGQQVHPEAFAAHAACVKGQKKIDEHELLQTMREFHACKRKEGQFVSSFCSKDEELYRQFGAFRLSHVTNLAVSLILVSLRKEYDSFVQNYNMHDMGKTVNELHIMLKLHEQTLPKKDAPAHHAIRAGKVQKKNNKNKKLQLATRGNNQWKGKSKLAYAPKPKIPPLPKNKNHAKDSGLRGSRKLKPGALSLYMGNGQRAAVEAIGSYDLCFPSGLVVILHKFYFASITRGVISVYRLYEDGFINHFEGNAFLVSRNNVVYFSDVPRDGIYEIGLSNSNTNDSSMYAISNKRVKLNLDSTVLWHYRLGHISKKRIEKLQHDGLLNSTDIKSFEKQGASYFVTFTDDFSRYGYVCLLKHKHEVFKTFKVFQKEVENQLGKTIKSLCSDHGDEYTSQEFLDHIKEHEIIAHRTLPYMPQHNGVFERRNRTLLDMVHSMTSQTTLLKSFWDYALEVVRHLLSDKTPKGNNGLFFLLPTENKVFVARNAEFLENNLITQEASGSLEDLEIIQEEDTHSFENTSLHHDEGNQEIDEPQSDIIPILRSTRTRHAPDRMCLYIDDGEYELEDLNKPANYKAALLDPESDKWLDAMNVEMKSMKDNEVWDLFDLFPNGKTVGSKWLFKKKTDMDDDVHTYKARLVKNGFTQTYGVDYEETFSPVADVRAIRILMAITGYVFVLNGGVVDWKSTKQSIFDTLSTEAEYIVASDASKEAVWVRKFIYGMGVVPTIEEPIKMYCDNTGSITIANESGITKGVRHYRAKVHYFREVIEFSDVKIEKIYTNDNLADPFTKALSFPKHSEHIKNIGMLPAGSIM